MAIRRIEGIDHDRPDASHQPVARGELLLLGGGVPMSVDGGAIGGIGVAGSGGAANDERCATAAITQGLAPTGARR